MRVLSFLFIFFMLNNLLLSQEKEVIHVITKRISKVFPYAEGFEVNVEGNNAEIFIETWKENSINVEIELISKHPNEAIALEDLDRIKYLTERIKKKIYLRNYVTTEEGKPTKAILKAKYIIHVPEECPVYLKNNFGSTNVQDLVNQLRIFSNYSPINLDNIRGVVEMRTHFGDIAGQSLNGNFNIKANRSNIDLQQIIGNYNISANYGLINLMAGDGLIDLNIEGMKTDVKLWNIDPDTHQHQLVVYHGNVKLPNGLPFQFTENTPEVKKIFFKPSKEYSATITVNVSFGNLTVEKKK